MSVRIRLSRRGAKKRPFYRIVVADSRRARDGKYIEKIGTYNPMLQKDNPERVKLDVEKEYLRLHIIDNGVGIDKSIITKIFQPYFTTKEKGTGLGLSICKKIIEDHGGNIKIEKNRDMTGTTTIVSFAT